MENNSHFVVAGSIVTNYDAGPKVSAEETSLPTENCQAGNVFSCARIFYGPNIGNKNTAPDLKPAAWLDDHLLYVL